MRCSKIVAIALAALLSALLLACAEDQAGSSTALTQSESSQASPQSVEALYAAAVEDSKQADEAEILPLVTLTPDNNMVTWSSDGSKVLLLSWHDDPEAYASQQIVVDEDGTWTFTDGEVLAWYADFAANPHEQSSTASALPSSTRDINWDMTLEQLLGLPLDAGYTHVSAMWVDLDEVIRPAYQPDVTNQLTAGTLDGSALGVHAEWFWAYHDSSYSDTDPYPWTRLGYTYDWADNGTDYGLTEFFILPGSTVETAWTKTTEEFVSWLAEG